jgi:gamma-glutamyltranspeptidase/glutathione hydrolase
MDPIPSAESFSHFPYPSRRVPVFARNMVAASQPLASQAGLQMLQNGGNAVDAAVAAAAALTVVEPTANGIGGDAFAIVWDGCKLHGLNGSGRSPEAWTPKRFDGLAQMPQLGWDSVTVPGAVAAWTDLSDRFGKLPFKQLLQPAIGYARRGFMVTPTVAALWAEASLHFKDYPDFSAAFLPRGRAPRAGETFALPAQADSLQKIADSRGEAFYRGELAERIVSHAQVSGGALAAADLAAHRSLWVEPVGLHYHGIDVYELPPNGQGLTALIALGILRHIDLPDYRMDSVDSLHLQVEAMKRAFACAGLALADPDWMQTDANQLLDDSRLQSMAETIRIDRAIDAPPAAWRDQGTVYLAAADETGMMVSFIQSNYRGFGSGIVVPNTGISLQNRGSGFGLNADHPNCVGGGKHPLHTIMPGFACRDGRPLLAFGVMGAHMQPQGHVQMITRLFDYGLNPQAASDAPRWCVDQDGSLALETQLGRKTAAGLADRGHRLALRAPTTLFGGAQLILRMSGGYCSASDHRKDGQAAGF